MTDDSKNSNLMIIGLGIVAMFFAYLIYIKSKDTTTTSTPISTPTYIPTQQPTIDNAQLYNIQLQTQQINETLRLQMNQIQSIQEQQLKQSESIIKLENVKCSNVVSMDNNSNHNNTNSEYNNNYNPTDYNPNLTEYITNPIRNIRMSNVNRENEELIADRMFGMK